MSGVHRWTGVSVGGLAVGLMSLLVVAGMVTALVLSRRSADVHRRAQVLAEQVHASTQELSALKWRAHAEVLSEGTADLSLGGALVRDGARIVSELNSEIAQLERLQPAEAQRLQSDVQAVYSGGLNVLAIAAGRRRLSRATLTIMQRNFQPPEPVKLGETLRVRI